MAKLNPGDKLAMLTVIERTPLRSKWRCIIYRFRCDCGNEVQRTAEPIRAGVVVSCGCHGRSARAAAKTKHGHAVRGSAHPLYFTWTNMRGRCNNPLDANYKHYGGRGISVCARWDDFSAFLEDMGEKPSPDHSIDRIDNNGNYEPSNCRWATKLTQSRNTRTCKPVRSSDGREFVSLTEAAEAVGVTAGEIGKCASGKQKTAGGLEWTLLSALEGENAKS